VGVGRGHYFSVYDGHYYADVLYSRLACEVNLGRTVFGPSRRFNVTVALTWEANPLPSVRLERPAGGFPAGFIHFVEVASI
jgi:hypothetical protein